MSAPLRTFLLAFMSVAFGTLVWFAVSMSDEYQVVTSAPLHLEGIPAGKAVRTPVPPSIELKLAGNGWRLASTFWTGHLGVSFPVSRFSGRNLFITAGDVAEAIGLRPGVRLVSTTPDSIAVGLDWAAQKTVPVQLDCQLAFKDGYGQVGPAIVTPESVVITGAESILREIDVWKTTRTVMENLKGPVEADVALTPSVVYLLGFSVPLVHVRINVEPFAEKTLSGLPVDCEDVVADRELILIPPKIDLVVRGGIRQLAGLAPDDFHVTVHYGDVLADSSGAVDATVQAPSGIQVVAKRPDRLQYVVRKRM